MFADIEIKADYALLLEKTYCLMKMSFFFIHGSRLLLLTILLFFKQRKEVIAVKFLFCKILKRKYSQMKILKLLSFETFHCASDDIFLKFL